MLRFIQLLRQTRGPTRAGAAYHQPWKVERCFGWMDNCRRLVVRYERHPRLYKAFCLVAIILWCVGRILK
jgi:transposase